MTVSGCAFNGATTKHMSSKKYKNADVIVSINSDYLNVRIDQLVYPDTNSSILCQVASLFMIELWSASVSRK